MDFRDADALVNAIRLGGELAHTVPVKCTWYGRPGQAFEHITETYAYDASAGVVRLTGRTMLARAAVMQAPGHIAIGGI